MPINESGYTLTIGPDRNGRFFDVAHGESYELPQVDGPVTVRWGRQYEGDPEPTATTADAAAKANTTKPRTRSRTTSTAATDTPDTTDGGPTE